MATLADIRNKLKEQEVRSSGNNKTIELVVFRCAVAMLIVWGCYR